MATKTTESAEKKVRTYGKKLERRAPTISLKVGDTIESIIRAKSATSLSKLGISPIITLELLEPFTAEFKTPGKGPNKIENYKAGDRVSMFIKAGLVSLFDLPEGAACRITCTGTVDTGKGNPAFTYDIDYD